MKEVNSNFSYGIHDEFLFAHLNSWIDQNKQPFFATVLTISNHHPYEFTGSFVNNKEWG